ncbi:MAG TPA: hypothetical protein PLC59_08255 [Bacteroidales bacterium]|nr:hypothetical protein [Bacteroidales bacterium]
METWKKELINFLKINNLYPYEVLNKNLEEWIKEYADVLNEITPQIKTNVKLKYKCGFELKIMLNGKKPFYICVNYLANEKTEEPILKIKYTSKFNFSKELNAIKTNSISDKEDDITQFYDWDEIESDYSNNPITEKGFVLMLITEQFKKYVHQRN